MRHLSLPKLIIFLTLISPLMGSPSMADAPVEAGLAVRRLLDAFRAQDPAALLAAHADDYDYNGLRKADLVPFGFGWLLPDRLLYRVRQVSQVAPGSATSLVDVEFTGRVNLESAGLGRPAVLGTGRLWIEVRRQKDRDWRVSAWRWVRLQFRHDDTPYTYVQDVSVNGGVSLRVAAGAPLRVEGETRFGLQQFNTIGSSTQAVDLDLDKNAFQFERWNAGLTAPSRPGRYYLESASLILVPRQGGRLYLAMDQVTVPVIVQ